MRAEQDGMIMVRAELCDRLRTLQHCSSKRKSGNFQESIIGIRRLAAAYGLMPVVRLAEALERAAEDRSSGGCPTRLYLDRLYDAIGCERLDDEASQAMIASVSVRLT